MKSESGWESPPPETANLLRCLWEGDDVICRVPQSPFWMMVLLGSICLFGAIDAYAIRVRPDRVVRVRSWAAVVLLATGALGLTFFN